MNSVTWELRVRLIVVSVCSALVPVIGHTAAGDDQGPQTDKLTEVVVTAQKREQNLQEVGTSITAFDSAAMTQLGMRQTTDVFRQVPGVQFNQFNADITVLNIRGVSQNDFADHEEPPVAVYSDEAYVSSMGAIAGSMFDLERVEVLRGPQGTLFGRNATGGLVQFISNKPTDTPSGYLSVTGGSFGEIDTEGAINGPLGERVDARLSFATNYHRGIIENRIGGDGENQRQYSGRLQFLFKLNDDAKFLLKIHGVHNANEASNNYSWRAAFPDPTTFLGVPVPPNENPWGTCNGCDLGGYRNPSSSPFSQSFDRAGIFDRTLYGATGRLEWQLGSITLTSITDFMHLDKRYGEDSEMSPNPLFNYDTWQSLRQFSQEIRLNGDAGPVKWISGLYFLDMYTDNWASVAFGGPLAGLGVTGSTFNVKTMSGAVFGQVEWAITNHWVGILGARYTRDEKIDNFTLAAPYPSTPVLVFNRELYPDLADQTYNLPSGKVELNYKFDSPVMLYASANLGAKGGGFVQPSVPPITPEQLAFKPEKLISYEAGEKATFWDGKARLNTSLFYYDYRDYQAFELTNGGLTQVVANLKAYIKGGEMEFAVVPVTGLDIKLGVSGLDSVIKNVVLPGGQVTDRVMPQAPKWSIGALVRYEWPALGSFWSVQADAKADTWFYFETFNAPVDYEPGKTVANLRLGYRNSSGTLELAGFCNNVTDKFYRIYSLDVSSVSFNQQAFGPPRWFGVTATYHFH